MYIHLTEVVKLSWSTNELNRLFNIKCRGNCGRVRIFHDLFLSADKTLLLLDHERE